VTWSSRDEALFARVADEETANHVASLHVGSPVTLHPRAGGMVALLRRSGLFTDVLHAAGRGNVDPLLRLLFTDQLGGEPPALLHMRAIYFDAIACMLPVTEESRAVEAWVRSLAAWLALQKERAYLAAFASDVLGKASVEDTRVAVDHAWSVIAALAEEAHAGAQSFSREARLRVLVLRSAPRACQLAGLTAGEAAVVTSRTSAALADLTDAALRPIADALEVDEVSNAPADERGRILQRVAAAWYFSAFDPIAEQFAVDRATPIAWEIYRQPDNSRNRAFLSPLMPLYDSLARRIASDPEHFAYAARCAEIMLFYAELEPSLDAQIKGVEQILTICPTHSNGRLVLSQYLCTKALRLLTGIPTPANVKEAEAALTRAEELHPDTKQIPTAKARLLEVKNIGKGLLP
jgi:hypothetical protein